MLAAGGKGGTKKMGKGRKSVMMQGALKGNKEEEAALLLQAVARGRAARAAAAAGAASEQCAVLPASPLQSTSGAHGGAHDRSRDEASCSGGEVAKFISIHAGHSVGSATPATPHTTAKAGGGQWKSVPPKVVAYSCTGSRT